MSSLPDISRLDTQLATRLAARLGELSLDLAFVRRHTASRHADDLKSPLTASRATQTDPAPANRAFRLLFCCELLSRTDTVTALGEDLAAHAWRTGFLIPGEPAPFHLRTAGGLYLLSDYLDISAQAEAEAVMGAGETTAILWQAARPSRPVGRVLDLGCGAGTLALLLAAHAGQAIGTDINPRAVALSRFNAALNGISNAEFRAGSLYQPVEGERFDLIVSQPPYYPSQPDRQGLTFLHGGERGDEIARAVLAGVPEHLTNTGRALIFSSWPDGPATLSLPGYDLLGLTTNRRELTNAEQSLIALERGTTTGSTATRRLAPEHWGRITAADIDRLYLTERGARGLTARPGRLRLARGASVSEEGATRLVDVPLFGLSPVDDELWSAVCQPQGNSPRLAEAVERGLLEWSEVDE